MFLKNYRWLFAFSSPDLLMSPWFILVHLHSFRFLILFLIIVLVVFMRVLVACLKSGEAIAQSFPAKASPRRVVTVAPKTYHLLILFINS